MAHGGNLVKLGEPWSGVTVPLYDALAADYDRFVNWESRLAHELPFLERLFREHGVRRVLDAACGTGQHAMGLAWRGYQVVGTDLSASMVARARENALAGGVDVSFAVAGFGELTRLRSIASLAVEKGFEALLCLGNSLPHLLTQAAVADALADFAAVLRPGGVLVIQNRNFDRVWSERERFMGPQSYRGQDGEWLFVRFYDFHDATVTFNMLRLRRTEDGWAQDVQSTELRPVFRDGLKAALGATGFAEVAFFGGYDGSAFDPIRSSDLIAVATRE
jgi:SAM-dependent methyltransferase